MARWNGVIDLKEIATKSSNIVKGASISNGRITFTRGDDSTSTLDVKERLAETPLAAISGRWTWSSSDDGERVHTGNISYGPFGYYSFTQEPSAISGNTNLLRYNSSHAVNTTTASVMPYLGVMNGVYCPTNGQKVKAKLSFRAQNAPANSTWGISLWSMPDVSSGTAFNSYQTVTCRAISSDITRTGTSTTTLYTGTTTTTNNMDNVWVLPMIENRTGSLTSTTYLYGTLQLFLVD